MNEVDDLIDILNHLPHMIVATFNEDMIYERAYGNLLLSLAMQPSDMIGHRVEEVVEPHRRELVLPYFAMALAGGEVTFLHQRNDVHLEVSLFPRRRLNDAGVSHVVGGILTSRDVSHRIRNIIMGETLKPSRPYLK